MFAATQTSLGLEELSYLVLTISFFAWLIMVMFTRTGICCFFGARDDARISTYLAYLWYGTAVVMSIVACVQDFQKGLSKGTVFSAIMGLFVMIFMLGLVVRTVGYEKYTCGEIERSEELRQQGASLMWGAGLSTILFVVLSIFFAA